MEDRFNSLQITIKLFISGFKNNFAPLLLTNKQVQKVGLVISPITILASGFGSQFVMAYY